MAKSDNSDVPFVAPEAMTIVFSVATVLLVMFISGASLVVWTAAVDFGASSEPIVVGTVGWICTVVVTGVLTGVLIGIVGGLRLTQRRAAGWLLGLLVCAGLVFVMAVVLERSPPLARAAIRAQAQARMDSHAAEKIRRAAARPGPSSGSVWSRS